MIEVRIVPLASKGFVPIDPEMNPARWYIEDASTGTILCEHRRFTTEAKAREYATRLGFEVLDA